MGALHKRPSRDAYDCRDRFRDLLKRELKREATDDEVRDSVDSMYKHLIVEVTQAVA